MKMEYMLFIIDIIGTIAFAFSGAMTAIRKEMDILGVMILGMVTAVGGGIIRDIILGIVPPQAFAESVFALSAMFTSALVFVVFYFRGQRIRRLMDAAGAKGYREVSGQRFQQILMLADTLGLGVFTVVGVRAAFDHHMGVNYFLPVFLGTITGVGGGLLRDMMAGDRPYIFVKHVYASASILGACVCVFLWRRVGEEAAMLTGAGSVIALRFLAIHYRWNLPKITYDRS
jgi:uncharacterized membrane protein YeiH